MSENDSYGDYSVDESDQQTAADTLGDGDVDDELDRGFSPPEKWSVAEGYGNTPYEEAVGESFEQRFAQEEPDTTDDPGLDDPDEQWDADIDGEVGDARAGRLVDLDEGTGEDTEKDLVGRDVGIDGAAASAEEAAVHVIPDSLD